VIDIHSAFSQHLLQLTVTDAVFAVPAYGPQNDVTLKMPAFEWGLRLGNGKYCTLRLFFVLADINRPQRSILPFCQFFIVSPDII
ncbi:hypothetical protein, partial [Enterobacter hormaechei]|uniref:hypothetical protein n=1 Tax=Enterobacter hormaechei TaxID=158836 RepID=UPI0033161855